jgi:hypothetical protein
MNDLTLEKQLVHSIFCIQLQNIDVENAKKLLADLHLLYLGQQAMFVLLLKQEIDSK